MKHFLIFAILIGLIGPNSRFQNSVMAGQKPRLFKAEELSDDMVVSQDALKIDISFINKDRSFEKVFWIFSHGKLKILYRLINTSESTFYLEPPHYSPVGSNPSFVIECKDMEKSLFPENLTSDYFVPSNFLKIDPKSVYEDTVDLLPLNKYNFVKGNRYIIKAVYSNPWGAFEDKSSKLQKVCSGTTESNVIEFRYPD